LAYFTKPTDLDAFVNRLELLSSLAVRADAQRSVKAAAVRSRARAGIDTHALH
jgi:hypothetical protein